MTAPIFGEGNEEEGILASAFEGSQPISTARGKGSGRRGRGGGGRRISLRWLEKRGEGIVSYSWRGKKKGGSSEFHAEKRKKERQFRPNREKKKKNELEIEFQGRKKNRI